MKGIRGVVVLAAAGLEALAMAWTGGFCAVCTDCFRNCWEVGCAQLAVLSVAFCGFVSECHLKFGHWIFEVFISRKIIHSTVPQTLEI